MYLRFPKKLHLELSNQCNAKCPMCMRLNPDGLISLVESKAHLSFDLISKTFKNKKFDQINHCGNYGDPLMSPDCLRIIKFFGGQYQLIHTNGSLQTKHFWKELASIKNVVVVFGIDGVDQDIHEYYRRDTNLKKILNNARIFNENGGKSWWQMIIFDHNKHQIESAKEMALELGFNKFEMLNTRRFYDNHTFTYRYNNKKFSLVQSQDMCYIQKENVECKSNKKEEIYIDANGFVYPCAYTAAKHKSKLNIKESNIDDIVNDIYFDEILQNPTDICYLNCKMMCKNKHERIML